jgi:serine/threonine protein kinase, bacterial
MTIFCPNGHDNPDTNRFCQACGSQLTAPVNNSMTIGVLLGDRYRITKEIGRGGFGRTYLCEDVNRFNEPCVLKEFAPQVQGTALLTKAQQLFEREAGVMYQLQHHQIPRFREMFRVNRGGVGQLFLVQDYVAGDNYQQILRQKRKQGKTFTEVEITQFLVQILPVLSYIHSLGVIHRDISPDNLISRNSDGLPVLIDFGGVKQVAVNAATQYMGANLGHSDVPTRLGKVGYAPNEQMQRGVVFPHSDLYALAATTLVLLTGKEPPELIDPQNFTWNWREHISMSPKLASILDRMLQLRPSDRFASAQDILTALGSENPLPEPQPKTVYPQTIQPAQVHQAKSQVPTVVAQPKPQSSVPPKVAATPGESSLIHIIGQTWVAIAGIVGAIGLGWLVASLTSKRPQPTSSPATSNPPSAAPSQNNARSLAEPLEARIVISSPTPAPIPTVSATPIATFAPTFPTVLIGKGLNAQAYGNAVKPVFISQNPQVKAVKTGDTQVRTQTDTIANDLGGKLTQHLSSDAIQKIGQYSAGDRSNWKAQINKLHLSERALIEVTNAKRSR